MRGNGEVKIVPKLGENISFLSVFLKGSNTVPEGEVEVFREKKIKNASSSEELLTFKR